MSSPPSAIEWGVATNFHRVRRLAEILVASQMRSGRSNSDPRSFLGRGIVIAIADAGLFLGAFLVVSLALGSIGLTAAELRLAVDTLAPLFPLVAVAATLIAGVMFELTNSTRFSSSDAANWMPLSPAEYVAGSAIAISYSYSPAIALLLGGFLPVTLALGLPATFALTAFLTVVGLLEGAVLVEMVRAVVQRTGAIGAGRFARLGIVLRAALLVLLILIFDLAFNPVIILGVVRTATSFEWITSAIPLFWSTRALAEWTAGTVDLAVAFAVGQFAFLVLLVSAAGAVRARFWVPNPAEVAEVAPAVRPGHPYLVAVGLSGPEAAIASKDLRGFVRRREMLPTLVIPVVLLLLLAVEGSMFGHLESILWAGWVVGLFAILLSVTSIGQERRSLQTLYAYPITGRNVLRAKAASVLVPTLLAALGLPIVVSLLFGLPLRAVGGFLLACGAAAVVLAFWGLAFAARYSDYQDRPRPQYLRPGAMVGALVSGMVILFSILVPATYAFLAPAVSEAVVAFALGSGGVALAAGAIAFFWARSGFDQLFRQLPF